VYAVPSEEGGVLSNPAYDALPSRAGYAEPSMPSYSEPSYAQGRSGEYLDAETFVPESNA
jgi:hypothetical protein